MRLVSQDGAIHNLLGAGSDLKIDIVEIAFALANTNRFQGKIGQYSVAQHSVLVSQLVPVRFALQGLMHDAHEAFVGDMATPVKEMLNHLGNDVWLQVEAKFAAAVRKYFHLPLPTAPEVKTADYKAFCLELGSFASQKAQVSYMQLGHTPDYSQTIRPMSPRKAFDAFIERYTELGPNYI